MGEAHERSFIAIFGILSSVIVPIGCSMPHANVMAKLVRKQPNRITTIDRNLTTDIT
jgi:hypothetical protein